MGDPGRDLFGRPAELIQRVNHARIDAKKEEREVRDGEIVTACEAACPADAIVFGNLNDANSRVARQDRPLLTLIDGSTPVDEVGHSITIYRRP